MSGKVSIQSQIAAVDAVASGRISVVVISVSQRELRQKQLGFAAQTLRWVQQNETEIRRFINAKKGQ